MSREWKPGDVVVATVNGRPNVRVIAGWSKYDPQLRWGELSTRWADGDDDECWFTPSQVTDHRPLVVIDPEDREQVERLTDDYEERRPEGTTLYAHMRSALRSLIEPPKPDEPQGLGAVVEDEQGERWIRTERASDFDKPWQGEVAHVHWSSIAAVRVLSEGVVA